MFLAFVSGVEVVRDFNANQKITRMPTSRGIFTSYRCSGKITFL